jgi:hypothetical protein
MFWDSKKRTERGAEDGVEFVFISFLDSREEG